MVALPLLFAFLGFLSTFFDSYEKLNKAFFLTGIFSPWPIFLLNFKDYPVTTVVGGWSRVSGIELGISSINHFLIFVELIVFSLVGVYSVFYFKRNSKENTIPSRSIFPIMLLLYSGILGCFLTRDLFNFYIYMEIASISSIILVACSGEKGAKAASFRYLLLFFLSSFFFIFSIGIIYVKTGTLNFYLIEENLVMSTEIKIAITIAFVSFITKAGIFPLHFWLPEAHAKADTPVSALLSGLTVKVPIFGMILFLEFTSIGFLTTPLMIVSFSTILFGIIMAILQTNVKKLLAYHTVSQMGFVLLGIATLNVYAAAHYAFAHSLFKAGLFLGVGVLISKEGTKNLDELSYRKNKLLIVSMIILSLAIGGVSPLIGAFGKHEILKGLSGISVYLFYAGTIGTLISFTKLNYKLFQSDSQSKYKINMEVVITFLMAILTILFGVYYYPNLNYLDIILISIAILIFLILKYMDIFEEEVPKYFSKDIKGLGSEMNFYTSVFVIIIIAFIAYVIY